MAFPEMRVSLERVFNHIVLPPQLPSGQDEDLKNIGHDIMRRIRRACGQLNAITDDCFKDAWTTIDAAIAMFRKTDEGHRSVPSLLEAFKRLDKEGNLVPLYIEEQNAGLLMYRRSGRDENGHIVFEAFEASPLSQDVLSAPDALRWDFPSRAVQIPVDDFNAPNFQSTLAAFIDNARSEHIAHLADKAYKAGRDVAEVRNAASPDLITHMLLSLVQGIGSAAMVEPLKKRVRDDVSFGQGEKPWRRLPVWLVLRVAMQRQLFIFHGSTEGYTSYKILSCMILSQLLDDCVKFEMLPALVSLLQKKLGRKMAKLETLLSSNKLAKLNKTIAQQLIQDATPVFKASIEKATKYLEEQFLRFKTESVRRIPLLPLRANDTEQHLSLPSSQAYLNRLVLPLKQREGLLTLSRPLFDSRVYDVDLDGNPAIKDTQVFTRDCLRIAGVIQNAQTQSSALWDKITLSAMPEYQVSLLCKNIQDTISSLVDCAQPLKSSNLETKSAILLEIFDQWTLLDAACVGLYPLLADFRPVFSPAILDVLQLPDLQSMARLRRIQKHMYKRSRSSKYVEKTIFYEGEMSFSSQFAHASPTHCALQEQILHEQNNLRKEKIAEWERECARYDQLSQEYNALACTCTFQDGEWVVAGCVKCYTKRQRNRMAITAHENLLPSGASASMAVVFELDVPPCIASYRNITWNLITDLAYPTLPAATSSVFAMEKTPLARFAHCKTESGISLASDSKAFTETHYRSVRMKCELTEVLLPLGSDFKLFDSTRKVWIQDLTKPLTLAHLCAIKVPECIEFIRPNSTSHPSTGVTGPSSYEAVASRRECPLGVSVYEFEAFQRLMSGTSRRWLTMLVELGCSNIDFGKGDAVVLFSHLAHQAGPMHAISSAIKWPYTPSHEEILGTVHGFFKDQKFVHRLAGEVETRLSSIEKNWREASTMEILITLVLRAIELNHNPAMNEKLKSLLQSSRRTTLAWTNTLRAEVMNAKDGQASKRASVYAFRAALLCRRTFVSFSRDSGLELSGQDLSVFIQASIALQQNLTTSITSLPEAARGLLMQDAFTCYCIEPKIRRAMESHPESIEEAVLAGIGLDPALGQGASPTQKFDAWTFLDGRSSGWISSMLRSSNPESDHEQLPQHISLHITQGHLLMDGKTIGKLPDNVRDSPDVKEVFGNRHFVTYPSNLASMSHRLATLVDGHMVHFGVRGSDVVIVSVRRSGETFEYIPRRIFINADNIYDLPRGLVDDCFHWLDRTAARLEIRRYHSMWHKQSNDWILNVRARQAFRDGHVLVDPLSRTAGLVSQIFEGFEDTRRLAIFQSIHPKGTLSVELRHLELSFFVNRDRLLECRELGSVVDTNQDAGTLYGYRSMIVLRDVSDSKRRSIITPLNELQWKRSDIHISVLAKHDWKVPPAGSLGISKKAYGRFEIDSNLGLLTCPPEPRLLFTKALLHAVTSFVLPDPLTGRTGEEEAFHTLLSGRVQPWVSLPYGCLLILSQIGMLAPRREYYPTSMKVLQKVTWDVSFPVGLQNDRYERIIKAIVSKASRLRRFEEAVGAETEPLAKMYRYWDTLPESDLKTRGEIQRMRYECPRQDIEQECPVEIRDVKYVARGSTTEPVSMARIDPDCKASAVFQVVTMLDKKQRNVPMSQDLSAILDAWTMFGGFSGAPLSALLPITSLVNSQTLPDQWGTILETCCLSEAADMPLIMFTLSGLAFAPKDNMDAIRFLAACAYLPELRSIPMPPHESFSDFVYGKDLSVQILKDVIETEFVEYVPDDIHAVGRKAVQAAMDRERAAHMAICHDEATRMANTLIVQWPDVAEPDLGMFSTEYIHGIDALDKITVLWQCLLRNRDLSLYVQNIQRALTASRTRPAPSAPKTFNASKTSKSLSQPQPTFVVHRHSTPSLLGQLSRQPHCFPLPPAPDFTLYRHRTNGQRDGRERTQPKEFAELWDIIAPFEKSSELLRKNYGRDLAASLKALESAQRHDRLSEQQSLVEVLPRQDLEVAMSAYAAALRTAFEHIRTCFSEASCTSLQSLGRAGHSWLQAVGLWPRLTPVSVLELLRTKKNIILDHGMFLALLQFGELITTYQRIQRLCRALAKNDTRRAHDELHNDGHVNWKTADFPDWLLLEIDSNMLIREEQVTVAKAMISPESGHNSVFQLNMGKGKTSMILPMVLSVIANGSQLARLIAPKALLLPTAQVLQSRLGGLVGREVRHVPFSRRLLVQTNCGETFNMFKEHHFDLTQNRGIFIAAPEHILAFKLSSEQCYVDARSMTLAIEMMQFHAHLRNRLCRDVLDESDFTLAVRTQLVYPSGTFTAVDGTPFRWELVQTLLSLVEGHVMNLADSNPHAINIVKRPGGGFPLVYILHASVEDKLARLIVKDIVQGRVPFFRPLPKKANPRLGRFGGGPHHSVAKIQAALEAALKSDASDEAVDEVAGMFPDPEAISNGLLLMRGLLQHDILVTCLKKRWNVQYGLHPKRWPIAVPYEARGVPSERSEFGHPDVTIIFTCLAFYYAGINLEQFRQGLNHVLHHVDDPATEYEKWSSGDGVITLPDDLQHWNSINVDDDGQVEKLWECLRFTRSVINHFLNTFVFPLYSRQFSVKLQASAWDLPIFTLGGSSAGARTTGFSGTNDNKSMLPLTIKQEDLPGLQQTNAEVLSYLLQQRNRSYICTGEQGRSRWTEKSLVTSLAGYGIQVFIDAGAYILESSNENLARSWLALADASVKAAVYFDEKDNRAWVVFRDVTASKAPLVSTPFSERLEECIVYYDEAHTRGVDLQLPPKARGALTLALGQTKDHTVQAAMRLRQLGTTQAVVFYAPPEVDQSIRDLCGLGNSVTKIFVDSSHVVRWLLEQTCQANEQLGSLYASHGLDFCRRTEATWTYQDTLDNAQSRKSLLDVLEQPERQTLRVMYGHAAPVVKRNREHRGTYWTLKQDRRKGKGKGETREEALLKQFVAQLQGYRSAGLNGAAVRKGTFEEVEQEREVEVQVEQQRDTRPRKKYAALKFPGRVCKAICKFVETGVLAGVDGYQSAFAFIAGTDIGKRHAVHDVNSRLFVSDQFPRTIEGIHLGKSPCDDFLRPVEWLLWSPSTATGIVVIPEELELLIPDLCQSPFVHLIAYAAPVTRGMLDFSSLQYYAFPALPDTYTVPSWLPVEMGILSGRLYMEYDEAMHFAKYIGQAVDADVKDDEDGPVAQPFCANPTTFLLEWLPQRRMQDLLHTPAAYVCQGRALRPDHAFFSQSAHYPQQKAVKEEEVELPKIEQLANELPCGIDGLGIDVGE